VTAFLDAIEIDDRRADILWEQSPVGDLNDPDLLAIAKRVADRTELAPQDDHTDEERRPTALGNHGRIARKLRGPRHPFE
jgi:hypothetical protein